MYVLSRCSQTNEKLDKSNFIKGSVTLGLYLHEVPAAAAAAEGQ